MLEINLPAGTGRRRAVAASALPPAEAIGRYLEQYWLWPVGRENPLGWRDVGRASTMKACLAYIEEVWTDMRPLRVHSEMAAKIVRPG